MRSDNPSQAQEWQPNSCVNGHRLIPPNLDVAWKPCVCAEGRRGHRTIACRTWGAVWYQPPHTDEGQSATNWH